MDVCPKGVEGVTLSDPEAVGWKDEVCRGVYPDRVVLYSGSVVTVRRMPCWMFTVR